jgi:hypothetical protein
MAADMTVILEDRPGTLAELCEATGKAGINIEGIAGFPCEGQGVIHLLVQDAAGARRAIEQKGITIRDERDVIVVEVVDRPGEFAKILRTIADVGVNVDLSYMATNTRLVIGADNIDKAKAAL